MQFNTEKREYANDYYPLPNFVVGSWRLTFFFTVIYLPLEMFVLYFGYLGNIKEAVSL